MMPRLLHLRSAGVRHLVDPEPVWAELKNAATGQSQQAAIVATSVPPPNELESAIVDTFAPDLYTAIVAGNGGGAGVGLVEIYKLK